jgi:protein-disulfide isomerase
VVSVVEFIDYRCPACRTAEGVFIGIKRSGSPSVPRVVRLFPLRRQAALQDSAALSAVCADAQGRFAAMHSALFEHAELVANSAWDSIAVLADIPDRTLYHICLGSRQAQERISQDQALGESLGVSSLPTFVVDREWLDRVDGPRLRRILLEQARRG